MSAELMVGRFAQVLIRTAAAHGHDLPTIFRASDVQPKNLAAEETRFGLEEFARLSRHVKVLMKDEFCGLTKSGCKLGAFELMVALAVSGTTLADQDYPHKPVISDSMNLDETRSWRASAFGAMPGINEALSLRLQVKLRDHFVRHREFPAMEDIAKRSRQTQVKKGSPIAAFSGRSNRTRTLAEAEHNGFFGKPSCRNCFASG